VIFAVFKCQTMRQVSDHPYAAVHTKHILLLISAGTHARRRAGGVNYQVSDLAIVTYRSEILLVLCPTATHETYNAVLTGHLSWRHNLRRRSPWQRVSKVQAIAGVDSFDRSERIEVRDGYHATPRAMLNAVGTIEKTNAPATMNDWSSDCCMYDVKLKLKLI